MDIKEAAGNIIEEGKAALDVNGDGKIEPKEVVDAFSERVKVTSEAVLEAVDEVKKGFDADGDGTVSTDEVLQAAEAATGKVSEALVGLADKVADKVVKQ
jgi:Ca2+-binding EF-hand superfamily protein